MDLPMLDTMLCNVVISRRLILDHPGYVLRLIFQDDFTDNLHRGEAMYISLIGFQCNDIERKSHR